MTNEIGMDTKLFISPILLFIFFASLSDAQVFDVTKYGAKADGSSCISQALLSAFKEACASNTSSKVVVPKGTYALSVGVALQGPCNGSLELQVDGTLKAAANPASIKSDAWVAFERLNDFTLSGSGTFDGQGQVAWKQNNCNEKSNCAQLPINIRFNFVNNSLCRGITSQDSKQFHINVLGCTNLTFQHVNINAPADSPNTDGIHIGRSSGITIVDTRIGTGDDCVSIGDGSSQIYITAVTCGPGHGISVGSLGRYQNEQPVEGVFVKNCTLTNTLFGARIKTWPASPSGMASRMHFEDITMNNVSTPVLIDQEYCPWGQCNSQVPSLIKISDVLFSNIRGSSATPELVRLFCSRRIPCDNVKIGDIHLTYSGPLGPITSTCSNVKPSISGSQNFKVCSNTTSSQTH